MTMPEGEYQETEKLHRDFVSYYIRIIREQLKMRAKEHDLSKLDKPEKEGFKEFVPMLKKIKYGSDEYKEALNKMKPFVSHHYEKNRHHPEHHKLTSMWVCEKCGAKKQWLGELIGGLIGPCNHKINLGPGGQEKCCGNYVQEYNLRGMDLIDLIEMFCDWQAATKKHDDGNIMTSIAHNEKRFAIPPDLSEIFRNTANTFRIFEFFGEEDGKQCGTCFSWFKHSETCWFGFPGRTSESVACIQWETAVNGHARDIDTDSHYEDDDEEEEELGEFTDEEMAQIEKSMKEPLSSENIFGDLTIAEMFGDQVDSVYYPPQEDKDKGEYNDKQEPGEP